MVRPKHQTKRCRFEFQIILWYCSGRKKIVGQIQLKGNEEKNSDINDRDPDTKRSI